MAGLREKINKYDILEKHCGTRDHQEAWEAMFESGRRPPEPSTTFPCPYSVPDDELPAPIPTIDEIMKCKGTEDDLTRSRPMCAAWVYKVNGYAVKFGAGTRMLSEAENMVFVKQNTDIRLPKLYAVLSAVGDFFDRMHLVAGRSTPPVLPTFYFLVMDYFEGPELRPEMWAKFDAESKELVGMKIGQMMEALHSIPSSGYYGCINGQAFPGSFDVLRTASWEDKGPFHTYEEFVDAVCESHELAAAIQTMPHDTEISSADLIPLLDMKQNLMRCAGQEPRLAHLDIKFDNMILVPIEGTEGNKAADYEYVFIDWQHVAWIPAWALSYGVPIDESAAGNLQLGGYDEGWRLDWGMVRAMPSFLHI